MGKIQDKVGEAKKWWQSKTIIGVLLAFIPTIIKMINPEIDINAEEVVTDAWLGADVIAEAADGIWGEAVTAFGTLLAIWGRIKANTGIKKKVI